MRRCSTWMSQAASPRQVGPAPTRSSGRSFASINPRLGDWAARTTQPARMYNPSAVCRRSFLLMLAAALAGLAPALPAGAQIETELLARRRVFPEAGAGLRGVKRDAAGRYYVLTAPGHAVLIYNDAGQRAGPVPGLAAAPSVPVPPA